MKSSERFAKVDGLFTLAAGPEGAVFQFEVDGSKAFHFQHFARFILYRAQVYIVGDKSPIFVRQFNLVIVEFDST